MEQQFLLFLSKHQKSLTRGTKKSGQRFHLNTKQIFKYFQSFFFLGEMCKTELFVQLPWICTVIFHMFTTIFMKY